MVFPTTDHTKLTIMILLSRKFHTTTALLALRNHRLFPKVDWERVEAGQYAVVDPVNPGVILYLSEQDYIVMVRVSITSNRTLKVLAVPGDSPDASSSEPNAPSQNSPNPTFVHPFLDGFAYGNQSLGTQKARSRLQTLFNSILTRFRHKDSKRSDIGVKTLEKTSMIKLTSRNTIQWVTSWSNQLHWWLKGRPMSTVAMAERSSFGLKVLHLLRNQGVTTLITRMKISLFAVNSFLGGSPLKSTQALGMRIDLRAGLPSILPLYVRNGIRSLDRAHISMWTSILFSYKGLLGTWKDPSWLNSTITAPHPDYSGNDEFKLFQQDFAKVFWCALVDTLKIRVPTTKTFQVKNLFFTAHAGPNHPNALLGSGMDAWLWSIAPRNLIREWLEATQQIELFKEFRLSGKAFKINFDMLRHLEKLENTSPARYYKSLLGVNLDDLKGFPCLSRLHKLYEAAGKVRVIAIVDYWTNAVLKPVHDWMFSVLERLPQDATFDQNGKTREFAARGYNELYSLDLKSATDLIPLALYRALFAWIFPSRVLDLWIDLLVSRDYFTPPEHRGIDASRVKIRYTCGQPMGALTSWASMALLHHALVLYAAVRSGVTPWNFPLSFRDYLVLGDDVVIANRAVAEAYMALCSSLGIPISLHKSFISENGMFNFANQTYLTDLLEGSDRKRILLNDGRPFNASPISMKEEAVIDSLPARAELATRIIDRGMVDLTGNDWLSKLVKLFLPERIWTRVICPELQKGRVHPVVNWILSVLFTPGSCRFASLGLGKISIGAYLATQLRKGRLWSNPLRSLNSLNLGRTQALQISILARWADRIYKEFLSNRKRLGEFDSWLELTVSPDLDYVLKRLFNEQKSESFKRWSERFRMPLKELVVTTQLSNITSIHLIEVGTGRKWEDLVDFVSLAESELPRVPDFISCDIEALSSILGDPLQWSKAQQDRAVASFLRVTNVLGVIDHLGSLATPGVVIGPAFADHSENSERKE